MAVRPRRSALYMPASNPRAVEKARALDCDVVILDLEDAVAPDVKADARAAAVAAVAAGGFGRRELVVRANGIDTPWGFDDLAALAAARPDAVLVPKVDDGAAVARHAAALAGAAPLWVMIETARSIFRLEEIAVALADAGPGGGFVLGTNDLINDTGIKPGHDRAPLLPWLSRVVLAARSSGLFVLDGVHNAFDDEEGFESECRQGRAFGMDGKTIIHPNQIATANRIFAPEPEEVAEAKSILEAFELPENRNRGAIALNGRMVERLHARAASRLIALDEAIRNRAQ